MNKLFNNTLGQLITLKEKKVLKKENKKIVSTCIFLPENPSLSIKTPVYILGLIKTIAILLKNCLIIIFPQTLHSKIII